MFSVLPGTYRVTEMIRLFPGTHGVTVTEISMFQGANRVIEDGIVISDSGTRRQ